MNRARSRGMTLLEVMIAIAILGMLALLIYGAFDSMSRGRKGEAMRTERARQGRGAVLRIARELQSAFISLHVPQNQTLLTRTTAFQGKHSGQFDRVDFTAFAHRRFEMDKKESDQCELGYFVTKDPDADKMDLVRREQTPIDTDPQRGGVVNVLAEDVEEFSIKYLDPATGMWTDTWDSTQLTGQLARLPLEVRVTLVIKGLKNGPSYSYTSKVMIPIQQPLNFGNFSP
jgi:general secretion pathway protein J